MVDFLLRVVEGYLKFRIEILGIKKTKLIDYLIGKSEQDLSNMGFPHISSSPVYIHRNVEKLPTKL